MIAIVYPGIELRSGVIELAVQAFIEQLVAHPTVEAFAKAILHRLAWRGAMTNGLVVQRP